MMEYENRCVQKSLHMECCSPSLRTILGSTVKCSGNMIDSPGVARGKAQHAEWSVSVSVHQTEETWFHRNTSSASHRSSVTLSWFFVVVFIDLFGWLLLFVWGIFVCFFISLSTSDPLSLTCNSVSVVSRETWELIPFVMLLLSLKQAGHSASDLGCNYCF